MERNPKYFDVAGSIFEWIERAESAALSSTVALTEILVQPYRNANLTQAQSFYTLLTTMPNLTWVAPSLSIANSAALLRATYRLQTPDALIAATATYCNASAIITNDAIFKRVPDLEVLILDDYL
jgi:predicted nucleic acid-binding protein